MWSSTFINKPLEQYYYNCTYKVWMIDQFNLDCDIKNILKQIPWFIREFHIPDFTDYKNYINEYGVCFEKHSLGIKDPPLTGNNLQHNHKDKEVLLQLKNGKLLM